MDEVSGTRRGDVAGLRAGSRASMSSQLGGPTGRRRGCCVIWWWSDSTAKCLGSDRERELGEGRRQLMSRVGIQAEFVVAAAEVLHEGVSCADHLR